MKLISIGSILLSTAVSHSAQAKAHKTVEQRQLGGLPRADMDRCLAAKGVTLPQPGEGERAKLSSINKQTRNAVAECRKELRGKHGVGSRATASE